MKKILSSMILAALCAGSAHAADLQRLLPAAAGDQVPQRLQTLGLARSATASLDRTPSAMSWAIDPAQALEARPNVFTAESREYWIDASAAELRAGVNLATSAPGALVRLSPREGNAATLDASTLTFRAKGRTWTSAEAVHGAADQDALRAAGMQAPEGTVVLKLDAALGEGTVELVAAQASGDYLVHVFEPASPIVMSLAAERDAVIAGDSLRVRARVEGATLDRLEGLLTAPNGASQPAVFTRDADGSFVASVTPDAARAGGYGLWEVHAFGNTNGAKGSVQRDARTAFAVAVASARLDGDIEVVSTTSRKAGGVTVRVGIEAVDASRYQLAGVLYGTAADGSLKPASVAHAAKWIDAGRGTIDLAFDAGSIAGGVRAPFEVRDLRLVNQADMSLIERRERAVAVR